MIRRRMTILGTCLPAVLPDDLDCFFRDGVLVDRRNGTPMEMDGYSVYLGLKALELREGADLGCEKRRILDAVLQRRNACRGFWTHGAWTGSEREIHMRFTAAAIRLLVEAYGDGLLDDERIITASLREHLRFAEDISAGVWFLHDSLELPHLRIPNPFPHKTNRVWGSSTANLLVLNTHLDTLITLLFVLRKVPIPAEERMWFLDRARGGMLALKHVLAPDVSVGWRVFGQVDSALRNALFASGDSRRLPARLARRIVKEVYFPVRHALRSKLPGFAFPDGYIERDICLEGFGFEYHIVNVWDLARFASELQKSAVLNDPELMRRCEDLADRGIDYAIASSYWIYVLSTTANHGGANELCEAMLIRLRASANKRWSEAYEHIQRLVPPTPALVGYDPLILAEGPERSNAATAAA